MIKKLLIVIVIINLSLSSCQKNELSKLDLNVFGKVTDQNGNKIPYVTIQILRGKYGNFVGPTYQQYQTLTTDKDGSYKYLIKDDSYTYRICCYPPSGYFMMTESCVSVNQSILNGQRVPNNIDFTFTR